MNVLFVCTGNSCRSRMTENGTEVSKRIDIFAAALYHGMDIEALKDLDLNYTPPLSNPCDPKCTKLAATYLGT